MSFPQKVKSTLWAVVDAMACNTSLFVKNPGKDFTRDRKLGFVQLIRFFLCMGSGCISHKLLKYFYFLPDEVPPLPPSSSSAPSSFRKHSGTSWGSLTSASRQRGLWESIPSLLRTAANFALPGTRRILPPCIPNSITNLPSDKFSLEQIKHIYHLHWDRKLLSAT